MKAIPIAILTPLLAATPAHATAGMFCSTPEPSSIDVSLVISRVVGGPLISADLVDKGTEIETERAQWWLDGKELRLLLIDPQAEREEVEIRARRKGDDYVGKLVRNGTTRPVRCEESG